MTKRRGSIESRHYFILKDEDEFVFFLSRWVGVSSRKVEILIGLGLLRIRRNSRGKPILAMRDIFAAFRCLRSGGDR